MVKRRVYLSHTPRFIFLKNFAIIYIENEMKERADCMSGYRLARTYEEMGFKVIEDSVKVENGKKYADAKAVCWKCMGRGRLAHFANIEAGICCFQSIYSIFII